MRRVHAHGIMPHVYGYAFPLHPSPCSNLIIYSDVCACWIGFLDAILLFLYSSCLYVISMRLQIYIKEYPSNSSVTSSTNNNKIYGQVLIIISFFLHVWLYMLMQTRPNILDFVTSTHVNSSLTQIIMYQNLARLTCLADVYRVLMAFCSFNITSDLLTKIRCQQVL